MQYGIRAHWPSTVVTGFLVLMGIYVNAILGFDYCSALKLESYWQEHYRMIFDFVYIDTVNELDFELKFCFVYDYKTITSKGK